MSWIHAYGCTTSAGNSTTALWDALQGRTTRASAWPGEGALKACVFAERQSSSVSELLVRQMRMAFLEAMLASEDLAEAVEHGPTGVILASTKGLSNDFIWEADGANARDPLAPLLEQFLAAAGLKPLRRLAVSNACSSGLAALNLAQRWLKRDMETVVILAADAVTPFVIKGFQSLKLLTPDTPRPFARDRAGFVLGEATACVILRREPVPGSVRVHDVGLDTEGSAVTRPSHSGESLLRAARKIQTLGDKAPDMILAHGTGTVVNDETEDLAFSRLFGENVPPITGSKWCVGHTLGASSLVDTIAACEMLKRQKTFALATTEVVDGRFSGRYLTRGSFEQPESLSRILVSSLGFGGMHAAALLEGPWT